MYICDDSRKKSMIDAPAATYPPLTPKAFPSVPTVKDAIGKEYEGGTWRGLAAPAGLPADVTARLVEATEKVANSEAYKSFLAERGFGYAFAKGQAFGGFLAT